MLQLNFNPFCSFHVMTDLVTYVAMMLLEACVLKVVQFTSKSSRLKKSTLCLPCPMSLVAAVARECRQQRKKNHSDNKTGEKSRGPKWKRCCAGKVGGIQPLKAFCFMESAH